MGQVDDLLKRINPTLTYDQLKPHERETLSEWVKVHETTQLDFKTVRKFLRTLRLGLVAELEKTRSTPPKDFLSLLSLFIPFYGIVKKWYHDENRLYMEARMQNLVLLEAFFFSKQRAQEALDKTLSEAAKHMNNAE